MWWMLPNRKVMHTSSDIFLRNLAIHWVTLTSRRLPQGHHNLDTKSSSILPHNDWCELRNSKQWITSLATALLNKSAFWLELRTILAIDCDYAIKQRHPINPCNRNTVCFLRTEFLNFLFTYLLTNSKSSVFLEKLTGPQLVKKIPPPPPHFHSRPYNPPHVIILSHINPVHAPTSLPENTF